MREPLLFQNPLSSIMSVWLLCALLSSLICQSEQDGHPLSIKDVKVYSEETDIFNHSWGLHVAWRDEFAENNESREVSYDMEVYYTELKINIHNETINVTSDNAHHQWNWTSPIPLQCTSHSVKLRRRDKHHVGEWTPLYTFKGQDLNPSTFTVYPHDQFVMVGSNVTFCCIFKTFPKNGSEFLKPISSRTYITNPVHFHNPDPVAKIHCIDDEPHFTTGSVLSVGYAPDDQNLKCITRDLTSVECNWEQGRKTHLGKRGMTSYTLNGIVCDFNKCVLPAETNEVTNWTLIAKNPLGVKTLTDTANPMHRVLLGAPSIVSHVAYARNVTLQWHWNVINYENFSMICQAMLNGNGNSFNKTFNGVGLLTIVLDHLQPFTNYTVQVRCGSGEHFYEWGDWSEITEFSTKEDIPEAVDVWIHYFKEKAYVLWKPLSQQQSHGIITQYELIIGKRREIIDIRLNNQLCYNITPGNERIDQNITVMAKNSAGLSPPSTIIVPGYGYNEVNVNQISNHNGGFQVFWDEYLNSTCGYVVEWFPTYNETQCTVEWKKIKASTWKQHGGFDPGVKYTVSVYACSDDKPILLKRSEGYAIEQKPSGTVQNLRSNLNGRNLELSWDEVPLQQQNGFIKEYMVKTFHSDSKTPIKTTVIEEPRVQLTLDPGSYIFNVSAITSGGEGGSATFGIYIGKNIAQMIAGGTVATLVFIVIALLSYKKRKWLKKLLYPDIPEPKLEAKWNTKGIYCTHMTEGYMKCDIQEVHSSERPTTAESLHCLDLISTNSTVFPAQHFYQNTSKSPVNDSYYPVPCAEKLISIMENPSYNMTITEPVDVAQISELTLEMQDSYIPAPHFFQEKSVGKDSSGYKPQTA